MIDYLIAATSLWHHLLVALGVRNNKQSKHLEVERKFSISQEEASILPQWLAGAGFVHLDDVYMTDTFLPAPEGEMKRVRVETTGVHTSCVLTRKHWVEVGGGKERQETEFELGTFAKECLLRLGAHIKGSSLLSFSKHRRLFSGRQNDCDIIVSIDQVEGLGHYSGFYMEIEVLVPIGNDVEPARLLIVTLAGELLGVARQSVKQSYFDMLTESSTKS